MRSHIPYVSLLLLIIGIPVFAQEAPVEIRIHWFDDGNESDALQPILDEFEATNPNIIVTLDIINNLYFDDHFINQLSNDNMPDLVRLTTPTNQRGSYLDLRPYLDNAADWDANFPEPLLTAMREDPNSDALHGYPTDITVSAPYINRTLFERAGVPVPSDTAEQVSWETWIEAASQVQARLTTDEEEVYAITMDRSGHRFWGVSLGQCAAYFDATGAFNVDNPGFRQSAAMLAQWHLDGLTPLDVWGALGDNYVEPSHVFVGGEVAVYYSGSWLVPFMTEQIGDRFDWEPVPNPRTDCGSSGMVGGGVLTALNTTPHPEAVGKLMSHLTTEENLAVYYTNSSILPGHRALAARGLDYPENTAALNLFSQELATLGDQAFQLQYHLESSAFHSAIRQGLTDMIVQDLTVDETIDVIENTLAD